MEKAHKVVRCEAHSLSGGRLTVLTHDGGAKARRVIKGRKQHPLWRARRGLVQRLYNTHLPCIERLDG
jgi:hypothetical protein